MRLVATRQDHLRDAVIDPWAVVHLGSGLALGLVNVTAPHALVAAVGYQLLERLAAPQSRQSSLSDPVSAAEAVNIAVDMVVFMGGWYAGRRFNER